MLRVQRGFRLLRQSASLLRADLELAIFPVIGFVGFVVVGAGLFLLVFRRWPEPADWRAGGLLRMYPIVIAASLPTTFANAALVAGAIERLRGGDPTLASSWSVAWSHRRALVVWTILSGLVGFVLQALAERIKIAGPIARWTFGLAWQLAATFVVPVVLFEGLDVQPALRRSVSLFKERWGENVVGSGAIALAVMVVMIPAMIVSVIIGIAISPVAMLVVMGLVAVGTFTLSTTLSGVFNASLYDYAVSGEVRGPFHQPDLDGAFRERRRKRGLGF